MFTVGQRVFGLCDWARNGAPAEYVAVDARNVAPLAADIDHTVATSLPIPGSPPGGPAVGTRASPRSSAPPRWPPAPAPPLRAGTHLIAGRRARLASLAATVLDTDGNPVPTPRHHFTPKRTRPLRFAGAR